MKAVFIVYNQAHTEKVEYVLDQLGIRGFTRWTNLAGKGSETGNPHMNTHTWPEQNTAILTIIDDDKVNDLLEKIRRIDEINRNVGIRAFVWDIVTMY